MVRVRRRARKPDLRSATTLADLFRYAVHSARQRNKSALPGRTRESSFMQHWESRSDSPIYARRRASNRPTTTTHHHRRPPGRGERILLLSNRARRVYLARASCRSGLPARAGSPCHFGLRNSLSNAFNGARRFGALPKSCHLLPFVAICSRKTVTPVSTVPFLS
jgi:hypothetical protein